MLYRIFLSVIVSLGIFMQAFAQHSNKEYASNPNLALQDAKLNESQGDIEKAIKLFKLYAALSGKDMTNDIDRLDTKKYPSWFNSATMQAIPMSDGQVLIVNKKLMSGSSSMGKITLCDEYNRLPKVDDGWRYNTTEEVFNLLQNNGFYIPGEGLCHYGFIYHDSASCIAKYKTIVTTYGNGRKETKKESDGRIDESTKSFSVEVLTNQGKKSIDAGEKKETKETDKNGLTIKSSNKVNDRTASFKFYPYVIVKPNNNGWEIIKADKYKLLDSSAKVVKSSETTIERNKF